MPEDPTSTTPNYARRRLVRNLIGATALVGGLAVFAGPGLSVLLPKTDTTTVAGPALAAPAAPGAKAAPKDTILDKEIDRALAHLSSHGSLDDWSPKNPAVDAVALGDGAVLSATVDGRCLMGGILNGQAMAVDVDPTGTACTQKELAGARAAMDTSSAEADMARQLLTPAADTARFWSSSMITGGTPSFEGMPAEIIPGVTATVKDGGRIVVLQARYNDACAAREIHVNGQERDRSCS